MTDMKRVTIALPDELDQRILEMKRRDTHLARISYSEVIRIILDKGLNSIYGKPVPPAESAQANTTV